MKMILTVFTVLVLCTNRLAVASSLAVCTPYIKGVSCEDIMNKHAAFSYTAGYYFNIQTLEYMYCGMNQFTGRSCEVIYNYYTNETAGKNGYYLVVVNTTNGASQEWTFCDMDLIAAVADGSIILSCAGVDGQWKRIADIDISTGDDCPTGWNKSSHNGVSFCRAPSDDAGCYSALFSTNGLNYSQVCGRARGYQKGSPDAFYSSSPLWAGSIDNHYVDGLSITHGNPRHHIWTYAVGATDNAMSSNSNCPCSAHGGPFPPAFITSRYYCESGTGDTVSDNAYYLSDPLWDGAGCSAGFFSCCSNTDQPWFHYQYLEVGATQDDIEVRICRDSPFSAEAILVDTLGLYVL